MDKSIVQPKNSKTQTSTKIWLWIFLSLSMFSSLHFGLQFFAKQPEINLQIAKAYNIPIESTETLQCYKGHLHYHNQGNFSGLLSFSPNIKCDKAKFDELSYNEFKTPYAFSVFLSIVSLFLIWWLPRR